MQQNHIKQRLALWPNFDYLLLLAILALSAFGVAMIYSATRNPSGLDVVGAVPKQLAYLGIGFVLMALAASVDYHYYESFTVILYFAAIIMLGLVLRLGFEAGGAKRWVDLKVIELQPSEIGKVLIILFLARFMAIYETRMRTLPIFVFSLLFVVPPAVLVFIEPDLGTALVYIAIWFGMSLAAGGRWRNYLILAAVGAPAVAYLWVTKIADSYQGERFTCFLNPYLHAQDICYNVIQAQNAVSGGGLTGQGYLQGALTQGGFVKVRYADFLFSVIGEEFGLLGALALLVLMAIVLLRILHIAGKAEDAFGRNICVGVFTMLLFQTFVNIGMNIGILPVTGITLPFMSYGGSSLLSKIIAIGIVEGIAMRQGRQRLWYYNAGPSKV